MDIDQEKAMCYVQTKSLCQNIEIEFVATKPEVSLQETKMCEKINTSTFNSDEQNRNSCPSIISNKNIPKKKLL